MAAIATKRQPELRLKAEDLRRDYKDGLLNSHSYLYYLIRALRKNGWKLHIPNISIFCEQWNISERSFYRAKNKLIQLGLLKEKIFGSIDLWIDPNNSLNPETDSDNSGSETDNSGSETDNSGSETDNSGSETHLEPLPDKACSDSSPSSHLFSPLSLAQDERETRKETEAELEEIAEFSASIPDTKPRGKLESLAALLPANEATQAEVKTSDKDKNSAAPVETVENADPDFLNWVIKRVKQFPQPPTFPKSVAIALIKRSRDELWEEYQEEIKLRESNSIHAATCSASTPTPVAVTPDPIGNARARLLAKWNGKFRQEHYRQQVRQEVELHPEWGISVNGEELEFA
jgi:hypothetical protein